MSSFTNRITKLEHAHGIETKQHKGATRLEAEASGMGLVILKIVDPKEQPAHV